MILKNNKEFNKIINDFLIKVINFITLKIVKIQNAL